MPTVLDYDATCNNELGYEYMLMSMASGCSFEVMRNELIRLEYEGHLEGFIDQIVDIISELLTQLEPHRRSPGDHRQ